ncbi:hypothetical protein KUTeg_010917 [Tegillarca granosa]|uniref:Plastocyanin-like domain-containing protein n=1 Tax=Tegillarca granosa TaxID=220873 RepID=A0ABQ9F6Q4_TEGGR|nr:hypothetical protein KUTeg_010917 [Tegillarca granosa]
MTLRIRQTHRTVPVEEVITVDGWEEPRMVLVANRSLPGPPIIVYKGKKVKVHVTNKLLSDTTSIHWHGLPQKNNNENDGLPSRNTMSYFAWTNIDL